MNYKKYQNKDNIALRLLIDCKFKDMQFSITDICKQIGIVVKYKALPNNRNGYCFIYKDKPCILIDRNCKSISYKRFTVAHELGHILLGHLDSNKQYENMEQEADNFATDIITHGYLMCLNKHMSKP